MDSGRAGRATGSLTPQQRTQFLAELRERIPVAEGPAEPGRKGEVSMYLAGRWYVLDLSKAAAGQLGFISSGHTSVCMTRLG